MNVPSERQRLQTNSVFPSANAPSGRDRIQTEFASNPASDLTAPLDILIDRWCGRRALRPISILLRAYPGPLWHPYHRMELLETLQELDATCRSDLAAEEIGYVDRLLQLLGASGRGRDLGAEAQPSTSLAV